MKTAARVKPGDPGVKRLDEFLCFAIYSTNLALGKAYKPVLEQLGLTYTQYIAIIALWEEDDQTVTGLGEKLFLESNTLTPILKKLEAMGYVRRQRDPRDERQVRVGLTEAGHRLRLSALGKGVVSETRFTPEQSAELHRTLVTLRANLLENAGRYEKAPAAD
ncbi:MarR family winged helix-turn-helix transcriptional regulator [Telluria aromaticivorans]|uniref:HTH-type transcriptional regulator SarZ n=1 Tax=Telluria aromaticivorans TaxID=2725995 RepID=A0A7Y2NZQ1_9BURK|nr:MarR family transcriptional regulator [Telluria aromaticivorans]NNG23319.1 MarR family transcriptional regulator [Telluria aromaticivorans]